MTGAPIPPGADTVIPIEQTEATQIPNHVRITTPLAVGKNISPRGSDSKAGETVLTSGTKITSAQIAVAASVGASNLLLFRPPTVAILGTGDELVPPDQTPVGSQIRSCNNPMLAALLAKFPCQITDLGLVPDDPNLIQQKISAALIDYDILLITGGMSMGQYDYVPHPPQLGGELKITKLRIKPGKPFVLATMPGGNYVFGLPGNPVSAFVCTLPLASRLLKRIAGGVPTEAVQLAPLAAPLPANGPRTFYLPAKHNGHPRPPEMERLRRHFHPRKSQRPHRPPRKRPRPTPRHAHPFPPPVNATRWQSCGLIFPVRSPLPPAIMTRNQSVCSPQPMNSTSTQSPANTST